MNNYIITYSNYFKIGNKTFSFRNKVLFDVTNTPLLKNKIEVSGCKGYWILGRFYSISKLLDKTIKEKILVDISDLQWYQQENLNHVFNL